MLIDTSASHLSGFEPYHWSNSTCKDICRFSVLLRYATSFACSCRKFRTLWRPREKVWNSVAAGWLSPELYFTSCTGSWSATFEAGTAPVLLFFLLVYFGVSFAGVVESWGRGKKRKFLQGHWGHLENISTFWSSRRAVCLCHSNSRSLSFWLKITFQ